MLPRAILFDLDDTLFDHQRASTIALRAMHAAYAPDLAFEPFAFRHGEVLEAFHSRFLSGELTLDEARVARMQTLFAAFDRELDDSSAAHAAKLYREQHQANRHLVEGAIELLEALRPDCLFGIVTNNSTAEQTEKLRALGIAHYFEAVVISEDVGVTKPDPKIFSIALERIGAHAAEAVFVGDNWENDIAGALGAGMGAVWFDRRQTPALARLSEQKWLESRASAGVSKSSVARLTTLSPTADAIAAIKKAYSHHKNRHIGALAHEQLETLAP
ncbi:MAG: HAD-IA family hydrolase [Usitatibacteraceae bacterium]